MTAFGYEGTIAQKCFIKKLYWKTSKTHVVQIDPYLLIYYKEDLIAGFSP